MDLLEASQDLTTKGPRNDPSISAMRQQMRFTPNEQADQAASDRSPQNLADLDQQIAQYALNPATAGQAQQLRDYRASLSAPPAAAPRYDLLGAAADLTPNVGTRPAPAPLAPPSQPVTNVSATSAGILGAGKGAFDTLIGGPAQLLAHGVSATARRFGAAPDSVLGSLDTSVDDATKARDDIFNDITQGHETAANVGQVVGGGAAAAALPIGRVADGAGLVSRLIGAGKAGAVVGAAQPVVDTDNYWGQKAAQTALGGVSGAAVQPVAELGAKALGGAVNKGITLGKNVASRFTGDSFPDAVANASPELQAAVKNAQAAGQKIDPAALSRQVEADSLPIKMSLTPGQATQDPIAISTEQNLRSRNPSMVYKYQDQNTALTQNLNAIRDSAAPNAVAPDTVTAGQTAIDALAAKNQQMSDATSAAYKALEDANGGDFPLDGMTFAAKANEALGQNFKGAFLPREVQGILTKLGTGDQPMRFENFENLRTILGEEARNATNGNVAGAVNTVRNTLENMPMTAETEEIKPLADAARAAAKAHFDMLDATPSLKAVDAGTAVPDNFIQKHVISAPRADLVSTVNALGDNPPALETLKAGVVNYLKKSAGIIDDQGNFSQAGYNKALDAIRPKLDVLFDADEAKQLMTVGNVARYTQAQPRGSYVNNSNTDVANLARTGGAMLAKGVDAVTGSRVGSIAGNLLSNSMAEKASAKQLRDLLGPGAGISQPSLTSTFLKDVLPPNAGRMASFPLAKFAAQQVE
jgi:hypothetical protein